MPAQRRDGRIDRLITLFMAITQNPRDMINQLRLTTKLIGRRFDRLPFVARFALVSSFISAVLFYGSIFYLIFGNPLSNETFLETSKCPACYGFRACDLINQGDAHLTGFSKIRFLDYVNIPNIHHGVAKGKSVILKKLGNNNELQALDASICALAREPAGCEVGAAAARALPASGTKWMISHLAGKSPLTACPTERLIERIMDRYVEKLDAIVLSARERSQLVTTLMISSEPILFQAFPAQEGWPFPVYVGSCGRHVLIESGDARPLRDYWSAPWKVRAQLALELLHIAQLFTDNPSKFSLYWTALDDLGTAVNSTGHIVLVDGRDIVVVDHWERSKTHKDEEAKYAEGQNCDEPKKFCPQVTKEDICTAPTADHNYYMLCHSLLSQHAQQAWGRDQRGLLHGPPKQADDLYDLTGLLDRCVRPTKPGERAMVITQLVTALTEIVGTVKKH